MEKIGSKDSTENLWNSSQNTSAANPWEEETKPTGVLVKAVNKLC